MADDSEIRGQVWANLRLTEGDLRLLGRIVPDGDVSGFATRAVRRALRDAEAGDASGGDPDLETAHRARRLLESGIGTPWTAKTETEAETPAEPPEPVRLPEGWVTLRQRA